MMWSLLWIELRKLKGSVVLLLCLAAPTLVAVIVGLICVRQPLSTWKDVVRGGTGLWAFFMLPMCVTALTALLAQIEHGPRMWDHLLALPVRRWRLFAAKGAVAMLLIALMSVLLGIEIRAVGRLIETVVPAKLPTGEFPWLLTVQLLAAMWAASWFVAMLQLWIALSFRSFVVPLSVGLAGTFLAVVALGAKEAVFLPWVMPASVVVGEGARMILALQLGIGGGIVTLLLLMWHLGRKEMQR